MALIKCSECGQEISDKASACPNCGCPVIQKKQYKCIECGHEVSENDTICPNCGYPLQNDLNNNDDIKTNETSNIQKNNSKKKKTIIILIVLIFLVPIIVAILFRQYRITVPDVSYAKEETAVSILASNSLIPNIIYDYDYNVEEGKVIYTSPYSGQIVGKNSLVNVYVSIGPKRINSKDSVIEWYSVDYNKKDEWTFDNPYIEENILHIKCSPTFKTSFKWKKNGFGEASILDTFSKKVPIRINIDNENVKSGVKQEIELLIPVNDLDVKKPTTLYTHLSIIRNGKDEEISVNFSISW